MIVQSLSTPPSPLTFHSQLESPHPFPISIPPTQSLPSADLSLTTDFFKIAFRPVPLFFYPAVCWATLCYGTSVTWLGVFGVTLAQVFGGPQYNFTAGQIGLIGLSPWIFGVIGTSLPHSHSAHPLPLTLSTHPIPSTPFSLVCLRSSVHVLSQHN